LHNVEEGGGRTFEPKVACYIYPCILVYPHVQHAARTPLVRLSPKFTVHASLLRCECHYLHVIEILGQVTAKVLGTKAQVANAVTWFGIGSEL
jgi:hypothetical protein